MIGAAVLTSAVVALSSEQSTLMHVSVGSSMLEGSAIVPSESLHSGAMTKVIPLTKRSRNVEDDGRAEAEKMIKKNAAGEHIEDNFVIAEHVRFTGFGDEKVGEIDEKVGEIDEKEKGDGDEVGEMNQVLKTKSVVRCEAPQKNIKKTS